PIFGSYSYELFALALAMMAVFYFSGTFFGRNYPRRAFFTSFASVYMVLVAFFSRAAYCAVNGMLFFVPDYENLLWLCASASILFFILAVCAEPHD
ncbi:MAG: hypothetical protein Q8878_10580, partial [Bacillota bacterium]|nr:hypothetical protein [Bacillota bacterium]